MKIRDFIGIGLISVGLFPVIFLIIAFALGVARIEFGEKVETQKKVDNFLRRYNPRQDEAEMRNMKTLEAVKLREQELATRELALNREIERIENLKIENTALEKKISAGRDGLEKMVAQSTDLQNRRMRSLSEMFGSMRPEEAAPILLTLNDKMVADIVRSVPEVRSQSKLMGALGAINVARAAKISELMGNEPKI